MAMMPHEPVSDYVKRLLSRACDQGVSDIHFEPYASFYRVRFRLDGVLQEIDQPDLAIKTRLAAHIKVLAQLDVAEKRLPQDGRLAFDFAGRQQDVRVSTLPTVAGEKLVLRLLAPQHSLPLEQLGFEPEQCTVLRQQLARAQGMLLATGPTGSGKSATLYACLSALDSTAQNICTVEDPVEIALPGVNQLAIQPRAGLGFAVALRALLRQDPDVIMLGEMRDGETADIAIKAAQTGHLVVSSLHTANAASAIVRLMNMGVARYNLASALRLIVAQRLLRRLCAHCKVPAPLSARQWAQLGQPDQGPSECYRAAGCPACLGSGYRGRVGVFELWPLTEHSLSDRAVMGPAGPEQALLAMGLRKVRAGLTSLAEVLAHTGAEPC